MPTQTGKPKTPGQSGGGSPEGTQTYALQFESLLEAVPDAMVGVDQAGVIRVVNRQTELLFGYDRGDLIGQPIEALVPESFPAVHRAQGDPDVPDPRTGAMDMELNGRQADGTEFPVDVSLSHIDTGGGLLVIAALRDSTERKREVDHNHRMGRLAAIVEYSDDAIIGTTLDGIITSWNPAAERMYGYSSEEVIDKPILLITDGDRTDEMTAILSEIRAGQHVNHLETVRIRKDGTAVRVSLTVSPIHDGNGDSGSAIVGASTIARDVTEQMQAFESARSMIESSLDSLVAISPQGMITDVNEATVKVTGVPRAKLIGTAFSDYFTEPEQANEIYQRVFDRGMAVDYPLTMRHRDGTLTEVLYNASVYRDGEGKVLGVFAAARDVTKQRKATKEIGEQLGKELERLAELERFQRVTVGRELKMIELKKEIEYLKMVGTGDAGESRSQG
jgi:PAS domain S-box-containing protein